MSEIHSEFRENFYETIETKTAEKLKLMTSDLTIQEADDKIAALLEERRTVEESKMFNSVDIGNGDIDKLRELKRAADRELAKCNQLKRELDSLKSKRNFEKNPAQKAELDRQISNKEYQLRNAKQDFNRREHDYKAHITAMRNRI